MPIVAPVSCWDHVSHKGFAPPLNRASTIELNTVQTLGKLNPYLNRIRLKFETTAIDSNFMHPGASPMKPAASCEKSSCQQDRPSADTAETPSVSVNSAFKIRKSMANRSRGCLPSGDAIVGPTKPPALRDGSARHCEGFLRRSNPSSPRYDEAG
jgi:hypothetical protein